MKYIEGNVRKIFDSEENRYFYDFEMLGENPDDTYGVVSLTSPSNPNVLIACRMTNVDTSGKSPEEDIKNLINRIRKVSGYEDLVTPKILRFEEDHTDVSGGFQKFLQLYKPAKAIYKSIFNEARDSEHQQDISILDFKKDGGKFILLDELGLKTT